MKQQLGTNMKRLIFISAILSVLFFGCSNPVEHSLDPISSETTTIQKSYDDESANPVTLPYELYVEKIINGSQGGSLVLQGEYINAYGDRVTVYSKLSIPSNAFFGLKVISMRTDRFSPALIFEPGSYFNSSLSLDVKFVGIELQRYGLRTGKTDFVYMAPNQSVEVIKNDGLSIDLVENKAEVKGAKLKHFSRYGFIRKSSSLSIYTQ